MEKFIKLHRATSNSVVVININEIVCVMNVADNTKHSTQLWLKDFIDGNAKGLTINESAEKVYAMIEAAQNSQKCSTEASKS